VDSIIDKSVQLAVWFVRSSRKVWDYIVWKVGEPVVKGCHNYIGHWSWSMNLSQVVEELDFCFSMSSITQFTWASENMVDIFFQSTAHKTSSVNAVVLGSALV
jgi:hypothetical protein